MFLDFGVQSLMLNKTTIDGHGLTHAHIIFWHQWVGKKGMKVNQAKDCEHKHVITKIYLDFIENLFWN
jgi:hypothetical protein